jgi:hypothetical protein
MAEPVPTWRLKSGEEVFSWQELQAARVNLDEFVPVAQAETKGAEFITPESAFDVRLTEEGSHPSNVGLWRRRPVIEQPKEPELGDVLVEERQ